MDDKKQDWKNEKSVNSDMNSCGCGGGTPNYAASDGTSKANASSTKDQSSDQFTNTGYQGESAQAKNSDVSGKSCKAGTEATSNMADNDDIYIIETRSDIYKLRDEAFSDNQDGDLDRKLNNDIDKQTDV